MKDEEIKKAIAILKKALKKPERNQEFFGEAVHMIIENEPLEQNSFRRVNEEEEKEHYFTAKCTVCGWWGPSNLLQGGVAIADTGDYDDAWCPICRCTCIDEM